MEIKEFEDKLYCDAESQVNHAVAGKNILLCIFSEKGDKLLAVGGQQSLTINREKEVIEINSKTIAGGWKTKVPGIKDWSIETEGIYSDTDEAQRILNKAFENDDFVCLKVINNKKKKAMFGGLALLSELSQEAPLDDSVTYTMTLEGCGALVDLLEVEEGQAMPGDTPSEPGV